MSKFFSLLSMIVIFGLLSISESQAQLPKGKVGIGSNFSSGVPGISIAYSFAEAFDMNLVVGYNTSIVSQEIESGDNSQDNSTDSGTLQVGVNGRIFLNDNDAVDPFLGIGATYADSDAGFTFGNIPGEGLDNEVSSFALNLMFGGQSELATNFFVYAATGVSYLNSSSETTQGSGDTETTITNSNSVISLGTTSLGVILYF